MWRIARLSLLLLCFSLVLSASNVFTQTWMKGKITFWSYDESHKYGVYIMDADGNNVIRILDDEITRWSPNVALSPDGKKVAFEIGEIDDADIAISEIDNGKLINLTGNDLTQCALPRWSPDGKKIAFHSYRGSKYEIFTTNIDGTDLKAIGEGLKPDWSYDGKKIAFVKDMTDIYIMNQDGTNQINITKGKLNIRGIYCIRWSPDDKKLLVSALAFDDKSIIYIIDLNSNDIKIILNAIQASSCCWSPDGQHIAIAASIMQDNNKESHIWTTDSDGRNLERLTDNDMRESIIDWRDPDRFQIGVNSLSKSTSAWGEIKTQP